MDGSTANARRKYHHVHHGGKLTEHDIAGMVRGMENKDAEIARLTTERDTALARAASAAMEMREAAADMCYRFPVQLSISPREAWADAIQGCEDAIRALPIDPDAQKALDKLLAKAREDGIREAADVLTREYNICAIPINGVVINGSELTSPASCRDAILALLNDGGRGE